MRCRSWPTRLKICDSLVVSDIKKQNPEADDNIFRSLHNVNMATIPGWRDRDSGDVHTFLEKY